MKNGWPFTDEDVTYRSDFAGTLFEELTVITHGTRYDISLCKVKSCRSIAKRGPPGLSAKFFINLHLAGSIHRPWLKIFLEVFALAPFPLPSFLHVKIKRAPAHS